MPNPNESAVEQLNLDRIVVLLDKRNVRAHVEQTGGGTATLFAGHPAHDGEQDRYPAVAGPGSYGWGHRASTADLAEFYVGPDTSDDTVVPLSAVNLGCRTDDDVADLIALQAQLADREDAPLTVPADILEQHGFDATGRSAPRDIERQREEAQVYADAVNAENVRLIEAGVRDRVELTRVAGEKAVAEWKADQSDQS